MALILMVVSETIGGFDGIGYTLFHSEQAFLVTDMWAWISLLGMLGYGLNAALLVLEAGCWPGTAPPMTSRAGKPPRRPR